MKRPKRMPIELKGSFRLRIPCHARIEHKSIWNENDLTQISLSMDSDRGIILVCLTGGDLGKELELHTWIDRENIDSWIDELRRLKSMSRKNYRMTFEDRHKIDMLLSSSDLSKLLRWLIDFERVGENED